MKLSIIVAMDTNRVIGHNNQLPWHLPADLQHVKKLTLNHSIVMGRKNYESIGRPLPKRRNIILSRSNYAASGCEIANSVEEVFEMCKNEDEVFIFGGEEIYKLFLPYVDKMYITLIHRKFDGDTYFPQVDMNEWREISNKEGIVDDKNVYKHTFRIYQKL